MWLLFLILLCGNAFAQSTVTITQYGYVTDDKGHVIGKYNNDINTGKSITLPQGYIYTPVPDQSTLNGISLYVNPQQQLDALRQQALKALADTQIASGPSATTATALKAQGAN